MIVFKFGFGTNKMISDNRYIFREAGGGDLGWEGWEVKIDGEGLADVRETI